MAIYHFSAQVVKRSSGASAVAGAAYRAGDALFDERTAELKDYKNKSGVIHSEILMPENAPAAFADRGTLWNAVEAAENRKDAQLAREINVAIPNELTHDQGVALVRNFVTEQMINLGMIADVNHHEAHSKKDMNNHAHIMLTMRDVNEAGFGKKNRDWNDKALVENWRAEWANHANKALAEAGHDARIDHRSFKDQGITDLQPTVHLGPAAHALEQKGVKTIPGEINRIAAAHNAEIILLAETQAEIRELQMQKVLNDSYIGEVISEIDNEDADHEARNDNKEYLKTLDLVFVKDTENGQYIWKNQFEKNEKRVVAFVEHVDKITAHSNNKTALKAMAQASVAKFGNNFKVTGGNEFRREMWLQGSLLGANVSGYEPTAKDIDDLQKRADDYKSQYKKDIVFDSKVEEMLLLRYAEALKEKQKMVVNERNPQLPDQEIRHNDEEMKNDGRSNESNGRKPEETDRFAKPGINAFRQKGPAQDRMQSLSERRLDAGNKRISQGLLSSDQRSDLQSRRSGPLEGLRWDVSDELTPDHEEIQHEAQLMYERDQYEREQLELAEFAAEIAPDPVPVPDDPEVDLSIDPDVDQAHAARLQKAAEEWMKENPEAVEDGYIDEEAILHEAQLMYERGEYELEQNKKPSPEPPKPLGLAGMVSAHRDKKQSEKPQPEPDYEPKRRFNSEFLKRREEQMLKTKINIITSDINRAQRAIDEINKNRTSGADQQRNNEMIIHELRRQKFDREDAKKQAYKKVLSSDDLRKYASVTRELLMHKKDESPGMINSFFNKRAIKAAEKKQAEIIEQVIKPRWPEIKAVMDQMEAKSEIDKNNEITILKREIESLKSNEQKLKDALEQAEKQRAAARAELDKLVPPEPEIDNDHGYER
jgi:hypothetical protein